MDKRIIQEFVDISNKDPKAEFECSVLAGFINTKDVADRILQTIKNISLGSYTETSLLRVSYPNNIRVEVESAQLIQRVCTSGSFKGIPLTVIKKTQYPISRNTYDLPSLFSRFRLREEENIRKDWDSSPDDQRTEMIRLLNRRTFKSTDELFKIEFSMVKARKGKQKLKDILKQQHSYELEIEYIKQEGKADAVNSLTKLITSLIQAFQQTEFILTPDETSKYSQEFKLGKYVFYSPVTILRKHIVDQPNSIFKDYTVTVKADGDRYGLYVAKDKRVVLIKFRTNEPLWTGLTASEEFVGDFIDGEFIRDTNSFYIFDIFRFKGADVSKLPLMGENSRLKHAQLFVDSIKNFDSQPTLNPVKIYTKTFLAGDGEVMEKAIRNILAETYDFKTDGLVFTPKNTGIAPEKQRAGNRWMTVYKWKPPQQNSIDFLLRLSDEQTYDPVLDTRVKRGELFIGRKSSDSILYPCETLTGEFVHKDLPADLQSNEKYVPAYFQPRNPQNPDAYKIMVPVDDKGLAFDQDGNRVEDNTIIECSYDVKKLRWVVMKTRYDKTYKYRVLKDSEYGNERSVADDIWTSIHVPVSEEMITTFATSPLQDYQEDEVYYKEDIDRKSRVLQPSYDFNNHVKTVLYSQVIKEGSTLLEFGVGKAGDFIRWKKTKVGKVVGIDPAINGLKQGCVRYLNDKDENPTDYRPYMLLVEGNMTEPLYEQESNKFKILSGQEKATTTYLEHFENLVKFDSSSSQFNIHYACGSEEIFRSFVKNIDTHTKQTFFGTCMDGQAVYSLLVGKQSYIFTNGKDVGGEFTKKYDDKETWTEEFGMEITVALESLEKPQKEYLVPFKKVTEIFEENGFALKDSNLFSELYTRQNKVLTHEQQIYSFLNRTFVFERAEKKVIENIQPVVEAIETKDKEKVEEKKAEVKAEKVAKKLKKTTENPVLFHGPGEDKGEFRAFSNMAEYPIQIEDKRYPTVEHYFQAMKANDFGDTAMLDKIMKTPSAKAVKALGKKVKNFVKEKWDADKVDIMKRAVRAKFVQHPELQKQLIATEDRKIGEADARNTFWGIGTSEATEKSKDPTKWKGQNQLGKIMMDLRTEFTS